MDNRSLAKQLLEPYGAFSNDWSERHLERTLDKLDDRIGTARVRTNLMGRRVCQPDDSHSDRDAILESLRKDGMRLELHPDHTPEMYLVAVEQNGLALEHVFFQTPEMCIAAVKQNPDALQFVDEITDEIREAAERR